MKTKLPILLLFLQSFLFAQQVPTPDHVVIVVLENHANSQIIGSSSAPYINTLANDPCSALFTQSFGVTHPSQPNYLYLFSGSSQNVILDFTPFSFLLPFTTANLGASLLQHGNTFIGYSEDLPSVGFTGDTYNSYARKHAPWVNWQDGTTNGIPAALNQPFTSFPTTYSTLPTLCFVIPNLDHDIHNGTITDGDTWLQTNLDSYVQWAKTNNSLLIITFDEDDGLNNNQIATIFVGQMVKHGQYSEHIDHNSVLRTLEAMYGLSYAGNSSGANTITDCWVFKPVSALTSSIQAVCQGGTINFTDQTTNIPDTWSWSFPGGTPSSSTLQNPVVTYDTAGNYDVTLVTSNRMGSNTRVQTNYINIHPKPVISLSASSNSVCQGDTFTVTASGTDGYVWLPASGIISYNGNSIYASPTTTTGYGVVGESVFGCFSDTSSISITVNDLPHPIITAFDSALTSTAADSYQWYIDGQPILNATSQNYIAQVSGSYQVSVTNSAGCSNFSDTIPITIANSSLLVNESITEVSCNGSNDGAIDISVIGGNPAYSFLWSNNATTEDISGLAAGNYSVIVTDNSGHTMSESYGLIEPAPLVISAIVTDANCYGNEGTVTIHASGGTPPYAYSWNGAPFTPPLTGGANSYHFTVTDNHGCSISDSAVISQPLNISGIAASTPSTGNDGTAIVTAAGGTAPYHYLWSNGQDSSTATGLAPGNYTVTITDSNGCTDAKTIVTVTTATSVKDLSEAMFTVYPNPASGQIVVSLKDYASANCRLEVRDVLGKLLYQNFIAKNSKNQFIIHTDAFAGGIYFLSVERNGQKEVKRVVVY